MGAMVVGAVEAGVNLRCVGVGAAVGIGAAGAAVGIGVEGAAVSADSMVAGAAVAAGLGSLSSSPPHAAMASKLIIAIKAIVTNFVIFAPPRG